MDTINRRPVGQAYSVCVFNYSQMNNFGDKLGWNLANAIIPPNFTLTYKSLPLTPDLWEAPLNNYDLILVGTGQSIFHRSLDPAFLKWLEQAKCPKVGLFGLQYLDMIDKTLLQRLVDTLDIWFVRNKVDLEFLPKCEHTQHVGDLLIDFFPLTKWSNDHRINIPASISKANFDIQQLVHKFQEYKHVHSHRIHPLLCALCSADLFSFTEQRELPDSSISGKFNKMLKDIFDREFEENIIYTNDMEKVISYKKMARQNISMINDWITERFPD
ncbi:MAG: hypothetical protein COB37_03740 [Kordiimonadales bacterium]|nr:MAG: hypothetical protein COB37_03740 [Kordiimonadales bacterium]